nr:taste receptor type 2 member 1-like [Anolis sagrei ordinatus]
MYPLSDYLILSRHWFTAWLCVFYCLKIVKSTHSLFLWFKLKLSWLVPRLIAGTLVVSLFIAFSMFFSLLRDVQSNMTMINSKISTEILRNRTVDVPKIFFLIAGSGSPLLVILICSILVVASLCKHIYRMKCKEHYSRSIQTKAHVKAAGTVLSILFLYISFYMVQTLSMTITMGKTEGTFLTIVVIAYPSAQAYILLLVNPKLNQAVNQMLPRRVT